MRRYAPVALLLLLIAAVFTGTLARAQQEDGLEDAKRELAAHPPDADTETAFVGASGNARVIARCKRPPCAKRLLLVPASVPPAVAEKARTSSPVPATLRRIAYAGPAASGRPATSGRPAASGQPATSGAPAASGQPAASAPPATSTQPNATPPPVDAAERRSKFDTLVKAPPKKAYATAGKTQAGPVEDVGNEALQIVGQIVVDRASAAAVDLLRTKLVDGLGCGGASRASGATKFPRTCTVLDALRLQDIAQSRRALYDAVLADATDLLLALANEAGLPPPAPSPPATRTSSAAPGVGVTTLTAAATTSSTAAQTAARANGDPAMQLLAKVLVPEIARVLDGRSTRAPNVAAQRLVDGMLAFLNLHATGSATAWISAGANLSRGQQAIAIAAIAFAACEDKAAEPSGIDLVQCPIQDFAREVADAASIDDGAILTRSQELALQLLDAATLKASSTPAWRERMARAADASFTVACLAIDTTPALDGCPPSLDPPAGATPRIRALSIGRYFVAAAIDGDANALVAGAIAMVAMAETVDGAARYRKSLRLLAAVLQYAETYADKSVNAQDAHQKRVKLLEDVTSEMTDRTSRDGDCIWSLGGSLRAAGGIRVSTSSKDVAAYGPVALPLGVGFQNIPSSGKGVGWHIELSMFDLGQYISYEQGGKVRTPEIADAIAPSAMIGAAWGKSFPFVVGPTVGYAPQYQFHSNGARGSIQVGAALGVYVPLFDIN